MPLSMVVISEGLCTCISVGLLLLLLRVNFEVEEAKAVIGLLRVVRASQVGKVPIDGAGDPGLAHYAPFESSGACRKLLIFSKLSANNSQNSSKSDICTKTAILSRTYRIATALR